MVQGLVPLCPCGTVALVPLWEIWRKLLVPGLVLAQPQLALVVAFGEVSQQMQESLLSLPSLFLCASKQTGQREAGGREGGRKRQKAAGLLVGSLLCVVLWL